MKFFLDKGHTRLNLTLPDDKVMGVLQGKDIPALDHARAAAILARGIKAHAPADISKKTVAVIIPDDTRLWARGDVFVPVIIRALEDLGVEPDRIRVIIALGTHADIPPEQFPGLCGQETCDRVKVLNSAGNHPQRLVSIGTTPAGTPLTVTREAFEADHIIIFGGILHHMLAGFGGGRKYILPGIAGEAAIQANHALAIDANGISHPSVTQGVCDKNPVSCDMNAGANLFLQGKTCTYAAVAANGSGQIFHADAGDLHTVFDRGCDRVDEACGVAVDHPGDFVLFSAGGHRTDGQLYQATKALFNAVNVAKKGAVLLFAAGCGQGPGNERFARALKEFKHRPALLGKTLAQKFNMPAYVALRVIELLRRYRVCLVSDLDEELTQALGFHSAPDPQALVNSLAGRGYIIPFAENILPRLKARALTGGPHG